MVVHSERISHLILKGRERKRGKREKREEERMRIRPKVKGKNFWKRIFGKEFLEKNFWKRIFGKEFLEKKNVINIFVLNIHSFVSLSLINFEGRREKCEREKEEVEREREKEEV